MLRNLVYLKQQKLSGSFPDENQILDERPSALFRPTFEGPKAGVIIFRSGKVYLLNSKKVT